MADKTYALARELLLDALSRLDPEPSTAVVAPGTQIAWDVTGAGLLWTRVAAVAPNSVTSCCVDYLVVSMGVGVLRCIPVFDESEDGCPPDADTLSGYAMQVLADQDSLLSSLTDLYCGKAPPSLRTMRWAPLGPEGGMVGGEWTFDLRVER